MDRIIIFSVASVVLIAISWRTLFHVKSHGFYRFFSWECIAWLVATNYKFWFKDPFSGFQIIAWILLMLSFYLVLAGVMQLKRKGKPKRNRSEKTQFKFEQTTELINTGIYKYIRHPLYSSLLFLTWGIFFKNITNTLFITALLSTVFLYLTALFDEKECLHSFGTPYAEYMKRTKRFIPYIL